MAQPMAVPPLPWPALWWRPFPSASGDWSQRPFPAKWPQAERLPQELSGGARDDSPTFAAERYAYRLPKASDEQKRAPRLAIQQAVVQAARVPLSDLPAAVGPSLGPGTDLSRQGGG